MVTKHIKIVLMAHMLTPSPTPFKQKHLNHEELLQVYSELLA